MDRKTVDSDPVLLEDLERVAASEEIDWERLRGRRILVTGATGLVGGMLARSLARANVLRGLNLRVLALVRNPEKGKSILGAYLEDGLELVTGDILEPLRVEGPVDYILHGASVTASREFVDHPVETIRTALKGTEHVLDLAREKKVQSMVYLSSMEIYGVTDPEKTDIREADYGYIDPLQARSSYSEGKRMSEGLCAAYAKEYGVPVKTARLAQTFGAGIPKTENRVFAQFARSILAGEDLVLHTDGSKAQCFCYTTDAVRGLLTVLLRGKDGEAYNISNEATFVTIREMAEMLIARHPESGSKLVFDIPEDAAGYGYAPTSRMRVNADKLRALGWQAWINLPEMFERLMRSLAVTEFGCGEDDGS